MKKRMGLTDEDEVELVSLSKYKKIAKNSGSGDAIAIVYATGDIISGKGEKYEIAAEDMAKTLKELRKSDRIKAVVLRIDSRGGSSMASDMIWREVVLLKEVKPVIVSMSDVAASGGYYISAPATKIVASPTSITGSIGVFGLIPNVKEFLNDKMGVNMEYVGTGEYSDIGRLDRPLKPEERAYIEEIVDHIYDDFIAKVGEGRKMSKEQVDEIAQGRVWTGAMAKNIGLVDELGGLQRAIEIAAEEVGLEKYRIKEYPKLKDPFEQFVHQIQGQSRLETAIRDSGFGIYLKSLLDAQRWGSQHSVQMIMPFDLQLRSYQLQ
jgi:protease-4